MAKLVFSYAHSDERLRDELQKHLSPLKRMGKIDTWYDRCIVPGEEFENKIEQAFLEADIVLLLVSPDFIDSDYCYEIEMQKSLARHDSGEAIVIPVILRPCAWKELPFGKILAATKDGKPITKFTNIDDGFVEVVEAVSRAITSLGSGRSADGGISSGKVRAAPPEIQSTPRSANLSVRRELTERDKDFALREGFEYLTRFFENSMDELCRRNTGLEYDLHQRDRDNFEASLYKAGKKVCFCGISRNSGSHGLGDITYSSSGISSNSCNDSMTIESDGSMLGYRPLMGMMSGFDRGTLLTSEGMAEYFWEHFIQPLK